MPDEAEERGGKETGAKGIVSCMEALRLAMIDRGNFVSEGR